MKITTNEKVKLLLVRNAMKVDDLATALGVTVKTIYNKYENEGSWTLEELSKMAEIFKTPINELVE
jgi:predicted transcriptional regulator